MTNIELYINNQLCDVGSNFNVRLNRVLMKPGELNTKDAQYSYSVSLPPTPKNHTIFNFANIEETRDKFNREYNAELIINSVRIFVGKFRLSGVSRLSYKGNLYVPAFPGIKGIFGETKMNEGGEWRLDFGDFVECINKYNNDARTVPQKAIFPYTLYGLLQKVPIDDKGNYTDRNVWDDTVRVGISDFPPSINVLLLIRHLFEKKGYTIGGTALEDEQLTKLYMSYKNDPTYVQPWNYGRQAKMHIKGQWSNIYNRRRNDSSVRLENGVFWSTPDGAELYACDLFDCQNSKIDIVDDPGGNIEQSEVNGYLRTLVHIPVSGYYKIEFEADTELLPVSFPGPYPGNYQNGIWYISAGAEMADFGHIRSAVKLLRDNKQADFSVASSRMDGSWYYDNMPQNKDSVPRYVPHYYGDGLGSLVFIDAAQNANFVAGLQWGYRGAEDKNPSSEGSDDNGSQVQAAKPAVSWDASRAGERLTRLAIHNPAGYMRYGLPDLEEGGEDSGTADQDRNEWHGSDRYKMVLQEAPPNTAGRSPYKADGRVNCVVWLEAGELLTIADVSDKGTARRPPFTARGWVSKSVTFDLQITPFRTDPEWLRVDTAGNGITGDDVPVMSWNDESNFDVNTIDLVKFLPTDMKIDDFLDNFCKAFNLQLTQTDIDAFELNIKQTRAAVSRGSINLDNMASVRDRTNTPLGLPSLYKLGFTVDKDEEGYEESKDPQTDKGDDGGGEFATGATEEKIVEQKSTFSYNWFKNIQKDGVTLPLAVISKHDVWADPEEMTRDVAISKRYTNQALRFWYYDGLLNDLGTSFQFNNMDISVAKVSNELPGLITLNYENKPRTILSTYFTVLVNGGSHYTELEGYLTPVQYEALGDSVAAIFNGDIYQIAEVSGYDPQGRNKTKIKLIRS